MKILMTSSGFIVLGLSLCVLVAGASAESAIYVVKSFDGSLTFTNRKPVSLKNVKVFTGSSTRFSFSKTPFLYSGRSSARKLLANRYNDVVQSASSEHRVDAALIKAVIHAESAGNPYAVSRKGALGLMQLMPSTARMMGVRSPFSVEQNIRGGTRLLAVLIEKYGGNLIHALAAYNAGEGAVERYKGVPPYRETKGYVKRVLALQRQYTAPLQG